MEGESVLDAVFEDAGDYSLISDFEGDTESLGNEMVGCEEATNNHDMEEGEINLKFKIGSDNDLDAAIANAKKCARRNVSGHVKHGSRSKSFKQRKRTKDKKKEKFIKLMARRLREPKVFLVKELVNKIGIEPVDDLVKKVEAIERSGGQLTADGKRRRTPGGVLWNLLKSLQPEVYKDVMNKGKGIEKEQKKETAKRQRMHMDGRESKRRRIDALNFSAGAADCKSNEALGPFQNPISFQEIENFQEDHDFVYKSSHAQEAWVEGLKKLKGSSMLVDMEKEHASLPEESTCTEKIRIPVGYDDL